MAELIKTESGIFKDHYEGINRDKKVICILDNNCVRFSVLKKTKSSPKLKVCRQTLSVR